GFKDGLPSAMVFYTFKKDGFLYIATQRGLCRYDGYIFVNAPDVGHSVLSVYNSGGRVYFEEAGVGLCEKEDVFSVKRLLQGVRYTDSDPDNDHFKHLYRDARGYIWASDFHHLKYFNSHTGTWRHFVLTDTALTQELSVSYLPYGDDLIVATSLGLFIWEVSTAQLSRINHLRIRSSIASDAGIFLATTDGKLLRYFPEKRQQQFVYKEDKGYRFVQKTSAHPQELICYSSRELFSYDPVTRERRSLFYTEEDIQHVTY